MKHENKKNSGQNEAAKFLEKIVINAGVGRLSTQPNFEEKGLPQISRDLASITGQRPQVRRARKSIAGFKIREGQIIGLRATLRRRKMVDFFNRLIKIVLPRVRDFRGLDLVNIDAGGVLNVGLREQFVFPEISPEQSPLSFSLQASIVPRKRGRDEAIGELRKLGVPLKKK
jgi:large subunit ribosomal protein L5